MRKALQRPCKECGTIFRVRGNRKATHLWCSRECYMKGYIASDETRKRQSKAHKGKSTRKKERIMRGGYCAIYRPEHPNAWKQGYVLEHRYVMSEHIRRPLLRREVVHHKNGDRLDNRIENLELFASAGEHTKHAHTEEMEKVWQQTTKHGRYSRRNLV